MTLKNLSLLALTSAAISAHASLNAYDDASDSAYSGGGNIHGLNGGFGFGAWSLTAATNNGSRGSFIGNSNSNGGGSGPGINSAGDRAWGFYAGQFNSINFRRQFLGGPMNSTDVFTFEYDNGYIDTSGVTQAGVFGSSGAVLLYFVGGQATYKIYDNINAQYVDTGIGFTEGGLTVEFMLSGLGNYTMTVVRKSDSSSFVHSASLKGGSITHFYGDNLGAGGGSQKDFFVNKMQMVPEPASFVAIGCGALAMLIRRRKR